MKDNAFHRETNDDKDEDNEKDDIKGDWTVFTLTHRLYFNSEIIVKTDFMPELQHVQHGKDENRLESIHHTLEMEKQSQCVIWSSS